MSDLGPSQDFDPTPKMVIPASPFESMQLVALESTICNKLPLLILRNVKKNGKAYAS